MKRLGGYVRLELPDLIRMNRLVRGAIDYPGFMDGFEALDDDERRALKAVPLFCFTHSP